MLYNFSNGYKYLIVRLVNSLIIILLTSRAV